LATGRSLHGDLRLEVVLDHLLETARDLTGARFAALGIPAVALRTSDLVASHL
jgi:hypothetical protein